jgi:hypothetical protein
MFKEIAIDPAAATTSSREFDYIIEMFGISKGRLIAAFPKKWKRLVYQAAEEKHKGTLELLKIQERLKQLSDSSFIRRNRPGEGCENNWLQAAVNEHERLPFDGIISTQNGTHPHVVAAEEIDGNHPLRSPNRQWKVLRRAKEMGQCCEPILLGCKHAKLIDPHFDPGAPRFRNTFFEILKYIGSGTIVDIFRGDKNMDAKTAIRLLDGALKGINHDGIRVRLFLFDQGKMHNRFVLSEIGGVAFHIGLDEDFSNERPVDIVDVLQENIRLDEWHTYESTNPIFCWE